MLDQRQPESRTPEAPVGEPPPADAGEADRGRPADTLKQDQRLRNCTPDRLVLKNCLGDSVVFAPLESRPPPRTSGWILDHLLDRELVAIDEPRTGPNAELTFKIVFWSIVVFAVGGFYITNLVPQHRSLIWLGVLVLVPIIITCILVAIYQLGLTILRQTTQVMMLLLVVVVSVGLPLGTAWRFGEEDLWAETSLAVLSRILQISFVSLACMVPGLLYFLFDRQRLSTLRDRFEQQIFRLDPNLETLADVYARFGKQIEETYGQPAGHAETRLARQRRWPIVVATATLALGWILTLLPVGSLGSPGAPSEVARLVVPQQSAVAFGFMGAYFFAINLILRRYARGDLRPKAYSAITVRILIVVILGWLIDATVEQPGPYLLALAFFAGIVPETAITFFREVYRGQVVARFAQSLDETLPLQHLEGVDLYDRARLLDEGVTNIESLAHHDLIDLLLETRIPAARLVDWMDQAILYLHIVDPADPNSARKAYPPGRAALRGLGIRTATDLEAAFATHRDGARDRTQVDDTGAETAPDSRSTSSRIPHITDERLRILLETLKYDEWMKHVRSWRRRSMVCVRTIELDANGKVASDHRTGLVSPPLVEPD